MDEMGYYLPRHYVLGRTYFYLNGIKENPNRYKQVTMIAYRPHPAELVVEINGERKLVYRRFLFSRNDR